MKGDLVKFSSAKDVLRVYARAVSRYPYHIGIDVACLLAAQAAMLIAPLYLRQFFNVLAANTGNPAAVEQLIGILWWVAFWWMMLWAANRLQHYAGLFLMAKTMSDLITSAFSHMVDHSYNFFISNFAGSLTHRVNKFTRSFQILYEGILLSFFPTALFITGATVVLFTRHPVLGTALAIWVVCFVSFQIWVTRLRQPLRKARAEADTQITATLADAIGNQSTILLFAASAHEQGIFSAVVKKWQDAGVRSWLADFYIWAGMGFLIVVIQVGLLYGALLLWRDGLVTIGDFVLIQAYLLTIFERLVSLQVELRRMFDAFADAGEMVNIMHMPHEIKDKKGAKKLKVKGGEIWFDDVSFRFHDQTSVLRDFNLTIAGGERVALVGPSGAGKTTVTKLLLRLYDVQKGNIKIDGQNIAEVTQDSLRDSVAFVPQEPVLFHRTLMENIRYGRRDATDKQVIAAAKQAHCHEFISKLPEGYNTFVGERGVKLSGGERQRVAIARALLKDAPILVLDEATSSLDSESEALIQEALDTLMQGKTVVVIAHRLSTIMKMDRIVVMEGGAIAATGTHLELVNQAGLYRKLWSIQAGGFLGDGHKGKDAPAEPTVEEEEEDDMDAPKEK